MTTRSWFLLAGCALLLGACNALAPATQQPASPQPVTDASKPSASPSATPTPAPSATPRPLPSGTALTLRVLKEGTQSSFTDRKLVGFKTQAEFEAFFKQALPNETVPSVNFQTESVLVVFPGEKPSTGYTVRFTTAIETKDEVIGVYQETAPEKGAMTGPAMTQPFAIVAVPKRDKTLTVQPSDGTR